MYCTNKALHGVEVQYQRLEMVTFALLLATHRLSPYFQAHTIIVRIDQQIRQILQKPDLTGRMVSCLFELDIKYEA